MTDLTGPEPEAERAEPESEPEQRHSAAKHSESAVARATAERNGGPPQQPERRQQRRWVPIAAGWIVFCVGIADIAVGLTPFASHLHNRLTRIAADVPGTVTNLTRSADVIIGLLLLMLSHGLRRRKHRALQEVMALLVISAAVVLTRGVFLLRHHTMAIGIGIALCVVGALIVAGAHFRREFYAVGDARTRWRALRVGAGLLAADIIIGLCYIALRGLTTNLPFPQRIQAVLYGLVGVSPPTPMIFLQEGRNDLFAIVMGTLGFVTVIITAYLFLRPAEPEGRLGAKDAVAIRALLGRHGDSDSLGYFALRTDKSVMWSPTGKSCIGYRVLSGVMLASGDPLGDSEAWPGAIKAFLDMAARHAWVPAVVGCSELGAEVWCRHGALTALELGDEAIVAVADFSLQGRAMRNVRQMVTRVERAGYVAQIRRVGDVPADEIAWLVRQADSWRGSPTERGFSMALGRIGGEGDDRCVIATATEDGALRALLHFVPWGGDGLSLDLMRRDRSAQPGLNDFMIVETIKAASGLGVKRISLNFAVFRAALERGERIGAGPIVRVWRRFLVFLSRWFQIESLYRFNAKFAPQWKPRFLVFPGTRDTIRIGLAALEAEAFLVWPTLEVWRIGRKLRDAVRPGHPAPPPADPSG
jgi:lysyl-tRNA synthetase class 2